MQALQVISRRSLDDLEAEIVTLAQRINAFEYEFLTLVRDKSCRYPGCTHEKWLDAHHVMHWADGGETSLNKRGR